MGTPNSSTSGTLWEPNGTVLVVDDDPMLRGCASEILSTWGFGVIEAEDGQAALEHYRAQQGGIRLVLMDIRMPRMGGLEATRKIRELDPTAKIILSSGYSSVSPADVKPDAFLPKPYHMQALRQLVQQVLEN